MLRNRSSSLLCLLMALPVTLAACSAGTSDTPAPPNNGVGGASQQNSGGNPSAGAGGGGFQLSGGTSGTGTSTGTVDCNVPNPPTSCTMQEPPGCGDGIVNQDSEKCDDGDALAGDGCNGVCQIEPNHTCPATGGECTVSFVCGDGKINPGEMCDQGQFQGGPGCSADCKTQEAGYVCIPGQQCEAQFSCGDGRIQTGETCDPPNVGNGCSEVCQAEEGWRCKPGSCAKLPSCGDGIVQPELGEKCDQGAAQGSPGCSDDCKTMDTSCTCSPGKACVCQTPSCGDGKVQVGEQCDDGESPYPGCADTCQLESGYTCPVAGAPCVPECGDGILVKPAELCDPGMKVPNVAEACNDDCSVKPGWVCTETGCSETVCGNGKVEGSEGCDPATKNNDLGDGCTATCTAEPTCPAAGGPCTTKCGDGLILSGEECDDGNAVSGDGCSDTCKVEDGFTCEQPPLGDTMVVPMVVRDFSAGADFEKGSSFATDLYFANQGLLKPTLDANGLKPQLASTTGTYNGVAGRDSGIASAASFAQWYSDGLSGPNTYHATLGTSLNLYRIEGSNPPTFVNRFGNAGDGLTSTQYQRTITRHCGEVGKEDHDADGYAIPCTVCYYDPDPSTPECDQHDTTECQTIPGQTDCIQSADGRTWLGVWVQASFDGNPLFFPADGITKPWNPSQDAQISGNYDNSWPLIEDVPHNFSFTTEVRFWFKYDSSESYTLKFVGDDDVWVFVNKKLAVDLGGIHTAVEGTLTITNGRGSVVVTNTLPVDDIVRRTSTVDLGLTNGNVYEIVVFQAERQTKASSYQLSLSGFNAAKSVCKPICGGTNPGVSPGEECDNGDAGNCDSSTADCYNKCTVECKLGPRCGDGVVQEGHEECDNGVNTDGYAATGDACSPDCTLPPKCGDGNVQLDYGEECDLGENNDDTRYEGCTTQCKLGPFCGDGEVNGTDEHPELCDDGINDGTYNTCSPGCTPPPHCGDGVVQEDWGEQCEPASSDDPYCTAACKQAGSCGDGVVDEELGEQCDYGTDATGKSLNDGSYGGCRENCQPAGRCGDGLTDSPNEDCDLGDGYNTGEYGGCTEQCKLGPHCGDGIPNGAEECDDGANNGVGTSRCTKACKNYVSITF